MLDFFRNLFNTYGFPPRWHCGLWSPGLGWLHILSDIGIWSAYYAIPFFLAYVALRRKDMPFRPLFWFFGAFILTCGTFHLLDAAMFWWPAYRLLGLAKFITALVSWGTVFALVPAVPQMMRLRTPHQLEHEVRERTADLAKANQALRESQRRLSTLMANLPGIAYRCKNDPHWTMEYVSEGCFMLVGYEASQLVGEQGIRFAELIHPDDRQMVQERVRQAIAKRERFRLSYRIRTAQGASKWVWEQGGAVFSESGQIEALEGFIADVTEQKRSEQSLRFLANASRSLATLVDPQSTMQTITTSAVPAFADACGVHMVGDDGSLQPLAVTHADPVKLHFVQQLAQCHPSEPARALGPLHVLHTGRSELVEELSNSQMEHMVGDEECLQILRGIGARSFLCVPLRIRNDLRGTLSFYLTEESGRHYTPADLAVAEDLANRAATAIENAQLYAQVQQADRRKDEFLAMLGHELRNPLAPLRTGLELLAMTGVEQDTVRLMQEQVAHMVRLVDDLLDVGRILRGKIQLRKERISLAPLVDRAVETIRPGVQVHDLELLVSLPPAPAWLEADPVRLAQVITNLLGNSLKYTEKGGKIWLTVTLDGDQAIISVRDTGIGIERDVLPYVFDPFMQAHQALDRAQGGLGIGLTLVRTLVEMHGGTVEARSEGLGKGSEFVVRLPLASPPQQPIDIDQPPKPPQILSRRILIVEDNVGAAKLLARLLAKTGSHQIEIAHDGSEGLKLARRFHPQLVLLDIGLPVMNGYEVAKRLREEPGGQAMLIVAITGYGQDEDRRRSKEAGFDEHILKPPAIDVLRTLLLHPNLAQQAAHRSDST